jgi:MYXO-CTERM domain-containing protein
MLSLKISGLSAVVLSLTLAGTAAAVPVYDEATNGDFSNNRAAPTLVNFALGQNDVVGQTGSVSGVTDRDYFTFIVPAGSTLSSLTVLNSSLTAGGAAFFGLQAGPVVTVDPAAATPGPLLGYELVSPADIGVDILPVMSTAAGAGGFTVPLGEGQYTAWLQDTNAAPSIYGLRFNVTAVPEPGAALLAATGIVALGLFRRRKGNTG